MNRESLAPCGVLCDLCLGFQREKNRCVGCRAEGSKLHHCVVCGIKRCPEKKGNAGLYCDECPKYPCRRIRDLDDRYNRKYGESIRENFNLLRELGMRRFLARRTEEYTCSVCGRLLCVHRESCMNCGSVNPRFPAGEGKR